MTLITRLSLPIALLALAACSNNNNDENSLFEVRPALELSYTTAPIDLSGIAAEYAEDVRYGEAERNVFDIYLPDCDDPTPLVIYIHGGGFTGGDKSAGHSNADGVREFLQNCVAFATINYTLLTVPSPAEGVSSIVEQGGVLPSLEDTARALQFMRYHFSSLNIDPENVAAYGASAGAGASLWLGTHDDLADPDNEDPVLRESTRLKAAGALATQSTYDLIRWEQVLLPITKSLEGVLGGTDIPTVAQAVGATNYLLTFLGVDSIDAIYTPENEAYRANVDMLGMMDAGDAPIYVHNFKTGFDDLLNLFLHHGLHALAVKERADEVGLESVAYIEEPAYALEDPSGESLNSFLLRHIK
ncbi:MAG: carboxylesterase family protein [Halioglobus sp.]|nr:carboxylesterase family protein [Halioglobus sp.]